MYLQTTAHVILLLRDNTFCNNIVYDKLYIDSNRKVYHNIITLRVIKSHSNVCQALVAYK